MKYLILPFCLFIAFQSFSQQKNKTQNVILITFDGLRWQEVFTGIDSALIEDKEFTSDKENLKRLFWDADEKVRRQKLLPFFWTVMANEGQLFGNRKSRNYVNVTNKQWFSYPGYNEILTGIADSTITSNDKIDNKNITVLELIHKQQPFQGKVAAFGSWDVFPYIINEKRSGIPVNAGFELAAGPLSEKENFLNELQPQIPSPWSSVRLDAFTHHYALEHLKNKKPRLLYIAYGETDDYAHDGKYDAYIKSAQQTDKFIEEIWNWIQQEPSYKNKTTLILTTDHGRGVGKQWTSHNSEIAGSDEIWIGLIGPDTEKRGEIMSSGQLYQNQVAATLAWFLGFKYEKPGTGKSIIKEK